MKKKLRMIIILALIIVSITLKPREIKINLVENGNDECIEINGYINQRNNS